MFDRKPLSHKFPSVTSTCGDHRGGLSNLWRRTRACVKPCSPALPTLLGPSVPVLFRRQRLSAEPPLACPVLLQDQCGLGNINNTFLAHSSLVVLVVGFVVVTFSIYCKVKKYSNTLQYICYSSTIMRKN